MPLRFRRFQTRLLVLFLVPLLIVLAAVYVAVSRAYTNNAFNYITQDLQQSAENFAFALADRNFILATSGDALSEDFGFKQVIADDDQATILSALNNLMSRLEGVGDFIAITRYDDNTVIANTLMPQQFGIQAPWTSLIEEADALDRQGDYPEARDVLILENRPYQVSLLPFLTPDLENWVTLGFEIDQDFTLEFKETVSADITVLYETEGVWKINASTLPVELHADVLSEFNRMMLESVNDILTLGGEEYVSLASQLSKKDAKVEMLLQRSLSDELEPFNALRSVLLEIFAIGVLIIMGSVLLISRNVTRPVRSLANSARLITEGDLEQHVDVQQQDEIGELASAFNSMVQGLAEKEKVRNLLGKVVSPQIANELMSKDLELGGEERDVTVLFADVRGFTSLCENRSPQEILGLLNEYFSTITRVIEQHGGVVDKYIGDAVMALFGAPLALPDAPAQAVQAALDMYEALDALNSNFVQRGLNPIGIGIGINTDRVVVGNMGSQTRLNYTAIGDGVNLASRLESLTRHYGTGVIVSVQTCTLVPDMLFMELDKVRVKGKQEPVRIFTPLMPVASADEQTRLCVAKFGKFLSSWYAGDFDTAASLLQDYADDTGHIPVLLQQYRDRLQHCKQQPPSGWDGVYTFSSK